MTHLLTLPREIRDLILQFSITHRANAPSATVHTPPSGPATELHDLAYYSPTGGANVSYSLPLPQTSPLALLATCNQLRAETIAAILRLPHSTTLTAECDVLIVAERALRVTWTYVPPVYMRHPSFLPVGYGWVGASEKGDVEDDGSGAAVGGVDGWRGGSRLRGLGDQARRLPRDLRLGLNGSSIGKTVFRIRSIGVFEPSIDMPTSGYEDMPEGLYGAGANQYPGTVICGFCALFERFLRLGPHSCPIRNKYHDRGGSVGYVQLDVITPQVGKISLLPEDLMPDHAREARQVIDQKNAMIHPNALVSMLQNYFFAAGFLERRTEGPKDLGQLMHRLSGLAISLDGQVISRYSNWELDGMWEDDQLEESEQA